MNDSRSTKWMDGEKRSSDVRGMSMEQWRMLVCDTS